MAPARPRRRAQAPSKPIEDDTEATDVIMRKVEDGAEDATATATDDNVDRDNDRQQDDDDDDDKDDDNDDDDDDDDDDESEEESTPEPVEPNLATRVRRPNAGSRMQQLIQDEQVAGPVVAQSTTDEDDEMFKEEDGDVDFVTKNEEKDEFDSDFGSTDSDDDDEDDDEGGSGNKRGKAHRARDDDDDDDERQARKKKRAAAIHKPFIPTFANQTKNAARQQKRLREQQEQQAAALTGDPNSEDGAESTPATSSRPHRPRPGFDPVSAFSLPQRESSRKSAVQFKTVVQQRLEESEKRRATVPKPSKKQTTTLTQADLIAEALETEEINRASLLAFYAAEEDRRAMDRLNGMRYEIYGPKLTFLSRAEGNVGLDENVNELNQVAADSKSGSPKRKRMQSGNAKSPQKAANAMDSGRRRLIEVIGEAGQKGYESSELKATRDAAKKAAQEDGVPVPDKIVELDRELQEQDKAGRQESRDEVRVVADSGAPDERDAVEKTGQKLPARHINHREAYCRNYLIFGEYDDVTQAEELEALFGEHTDWATSRKPRALSEGESSHVAVSEIDLSLTMCSSQFTAERHPICPITGLRARYIEPVTGTPYANVEAYRVLSAIVASLPSVSRPTHGAMEQQPLCPFIFTSTRQRSYKPAPLNEFGDSALPGELIPIGDVAAMTPATEDKMVTLAADLAPTSDITHQPLLSDGRPATYYIPELADEEDDGIGAFVGMTGLGVWSDVEIYKSRIGASLYQTYDHDAVTASGVRRGSRAIIGGSSAMAGMTSATGVSMTGPGSMSINSRTGRRKSEAEDNPYEREYIPSSSRRRRSRGVAASVEAPDASDQAVELSSATVAQMDEALPGTTSDAAAGEQQSGDKVSATSKRIRPQRRQAGRKRARYDNESDDEDFVV
ncbi:hypothetical protein OIO90_004080 [Microbotryomycetes sp. JL221]|nr:hypothetical protein OIO90_004080 [Microbotryomycetes sp. JL221]